MADLDEMPKKSYASLDLKPADMEGLDLSAGDGVRVVMTGKVESLHEHKYDDEGEKTGGFSLNIEKVRVVKESNQFMALSDEDD